MKIDVVKIVPFIKWAGGKRQLIPEIKRRLPNNFDRDKNTYFEPFLGGGALLFHLLPKQAVISDIMYELVMSYRQVRDNVKDLMSKLDIYEEEHQKNPLKHYYEIRELDRDDIVYNALTDTDKAARMIYLNKSCFNGLYRVNKKGYFNVPFNHKQKVKTYDQQNLLNISKYLKNNKITILNLDFEEVVKKAKKGDFIFFDPPYDLLTDATFRGYNTEIFGEDGQKRLAKVFNELNDKGCNILLCNYDTDLIRELYSDFHYDIVDIMRSINSKANNRKGKEVLIYNYDPYNYTIG